MSLLLSLQGAAVLALLFVVYSVRHHQHRRRPDQSSRVVDEKHADADPIKDALGAAIEPLPDFDWATAEPRQLRPFRPKYNITMGKTLSPSQAIPND